MRKDGSFFACIFSRVFIVSNFQMATGGMGFLSLEVRVFSLFESLSKLSFVLFVVCLVGENPPSDAESTRFHELDILFRFNFMDSWSCTSSPSKSSLA